MEGASNREMVKLLVMFGIYFSCVSSIGEIVALFSKSLSTQSSIYTPLGVKLIKDLIFALLISLGLKQVVQSRRIHVVQMYFLPLVTITLVLALLSYKTHWVYPIAGTRWLLPLVVGFMLVGLVDKTIITSLTGAVNVVVIINFGIQIIQAFGGLRWYGEGRFGLALRSPGLFLIPSSLAFMITAATFLNLFVHKAKSPIRFFVLITAPISLYLSASGSGYIVYFVIICLYFASHIFKDRVPASLVVTALSCAAFLGFIVLPAFTSRHAILNTSLLQRYYILLEMFNLSDIFGKFGYATNTAVLMKDYFKLHDVSVVIADSTYASILGNYGWIGMGFFLLLSEIWLIIIFSLRRNHQLVAFTALFSLFGFTTIIYEVYPINLIFAVLLAFYIKEIGRMGIDTDYPKDP